MRRRRFPTSGGPVQCRFCGRRCHYASLRSARNILKYGCPLCNKKTTMNGNRNPRR